MKLLLPSLLVMSLLACSSATMTTPTALNGVDLGPRKYDPLLNTLLCKWRDEVGVPAWIQENCPGGVQACTSAHAIPMVVTLSNQQKVYIEDKGYAPYYKVFDYPQPWCQ